MGQVTLYLGNKSSERKSMQRTYESPNGKVFYYLVEAKMAGFDANSFVCEHALLSQSAQSA